jgi:hypothetical protein
LLPAVPSEQLGPQAQTSIDGQRMQAIDDHRPQFHQLVPVPQLSEYFPTFLRVAKQRRKLIMHHQLQDQVGIAPIVLLPAARQSSDLCCVAYQQFVAQLFH